MGNKIEIEIEYIPVENGENEHWSSVKQKFVACVYSNEFRKEAVNLAVDTSDSATYLLRTFLTGEQILHLEKKGHE
jgi:hypothetical protein